MTAGRNISEAIEAWRALSDAERAYIYLRLRNDSTVKSRPYVARQLEVVNALLRAAVEPEAVLCCEVTMNLCGTDTWAEGYSCECANCQEWLKTRHSTFTFDEVRR